MRAGFDSPEGLNALASPSRVEYNEVVLLIVVLLLLTIAAVLRRPGHATGHNRGLVGLRALAGNRRLRRLWWAEIVTWPG